MPNKKAASFIEGALILMVANVVVKIIGAFYKIPLTNLIGASGMGYMNDAYDFYTFLLVISTAGLPVAVSRMVSTAYALGNHSDVKKIFRITLAAFAAIGFIGMAIMLFGAKAFARGINNDNSWYSIMAIAPAVFFVTVSSTYRGYFQGLSNMVPTAISQVIEALCKLFIGLVLAAYMLNLNQPVYIASAGAILGVTLGTLLSALYLMASFSLSKRTMGITRIEGVQRRSTSARGILKELISIAVPVTIGASVLSLTNLIDLFIVKNRLGSIGFTQEQANFLSGAYSMSRTLFNLPTSMIVPLGVSVIPVIASAYALKNAPRIRANISTAIGVSSLFAIPAGIGISVLAEPILNLLYYNRPDDVKVAAPLLVPLGIAVIFVSLVSVTNAILQAVSRERLPVFSMAIGGIVKLSLNYTLIGIKDINIYGAPIGTICCYGTITMLNLYFIFKYTRTRLDFMQIFIKPLISGLAMAACTALSYNVFLPKTGAKFATLIAICIAVVVYLAVLICLKGLRKRDILLLPKGDKIAASLEKRNLLAKERSRSGEKR